jgi:hypothetical protein
MNVRRVAWQQFARWRMGQAALVLAFVFCALAMAPGGAPTAAVAQETKAKIAFVGDSTSDGLWGGFSALAPRNSCLKGSVDLGRFAKNSTGLTRPERYSWPDEMKRIGDSYKPALFIMSLGLNDRQSVVFGGKVTLDTSPD